MNRAVVTLKTITFSISRRTRSFKMPVKSDIYNKENGITQYILSNKEDGLVVKIIDHGATITNILVIDKDGQQRDVVLGWDDLDGYLGKKGDNPYFGASIGRYANRFVEF